MNAFGRVKSGKLVESATRNFTFGFRDGFQARAGATFRSILGFCRIRGFQGLGFFRASGLLRTLGLFRTVALTPATDFYRVGFRPSALFLGLFLDALRAVARDRAGSRETLFQCS